MNIQPIVFSVPSAPAPVAKPAASVNWLPWVAVGVLALLFAWSQFRTSDVKPGPGPITVIREAVDAAELAQNKEAANYALAHRRLAELVRNKTVSTQTQLFSNSEALMKGARENAFPPILGPVDNRFLPEKFDGKESEVANYLESLAIGFEKAAK